MSPGFRSDAQDGTDSALASTDVAPEQGSLRTLYEGVAVGVKALLGADRVYVNVTTGRSGPVTAAIAGHDPTRQSDGPTFAASENGGGVPLEGGSGRVGQSLACRLAGRDRSEAVVAAERGPGGPAWTQAERANLEGFCAEVEPLVVAALVRSAPEAGARDTTAEATATLRTMVPAPGEIADLLFELDWEATPLGAVDRWPSSLRTVVGVCMRSRFPILVWWGPELVMIYNDAYRPILGTSKHPHAMGAGGREVWPEIWDVIGPMLTGVLAGDEATWSEDQLLLLDRNGFVEECYFTFSYSPITDESGGVGGVFTAVYETTGRVVGDRRMDCLRRLARLSVQAADVGQLAAALLGLLDGEVLDLPYALLYLFDPDGSLHLVGTSGTPPPDPWAGGRPEDCLAWPLTKAFGRDELLPVRVEGDARRALVVPVTEASASVPLGVLVAGLAPQRPFDADYGSHVRLVAAQFATGIAGARSLEAERRRAEVLAELDRAKNTFFSNVSHEFRTPLTLVLGPVRDLLDTDPGDVVPVGRTVLQAVQRNALRLLRLTNTLLDLARLEAGQADAVFLPIDLAATTREAAEAFQSTIEGGALGFTLSCTPLPRPVWLDPNLWEKVVFNLLSNAFKFTLEGSIAVRTATDGDRAQLIVADTGTGITAEELPHLFDPLPPRACRPGAQPRGFGNRSGLRQADRGPPRRHHRGEVGPG